MIIKYDTVTGVDRGAGIVSELIRQPWVTDTEYRGKIHLIFFLMSK